MREAGRQTFYPFPAAPFLSLSACKPCPPFSLSQTSERRSSKATSLGVCVCVEVLTSSLLYSLRAGGDRQRVPLMHAHTHTHTHTHTHPHTTSAKQHAKTPTKARQRRHQGRPHASKMHTRRHKISRCATTSIFLCVRACLILARVRVGCSSCATLCAPCRVQDRGFRVESRGFRHLRQRL